MKPYPHLRLLSLFLLTAVFSTSCKTEVAESEQWRDYIRWAPTTVEQHERIQEVLAGFKRKMEDHLQGIKERYDDTTWTLMQENQSAWETYAKTEASLKSDIWRGGSLQGVLYGNVLLEQYEARLIWLSDWEKYQTTP